VCAPWLGLLADRFPRRRVMVTADLVRVVLVGLMAVLAAAGQSFWAIFVLAVLTTIASTAFSPAQGALLPSLVRTPEELTAANAVMNTIESVGMFAGPAFAGLLLATTSIWVVFAITAGTFLWSAACLVGVPPDSRPAEAEPTPVGSAVLEGFRAIAAHPALRVVVGLTAAQTFVVGAFEVLLVVVALKLLHAGSGGVGWLNGALAGRKRLAGDLGIGVLLWGVPLALTAVWSNLAFALLLFGLIGLGNTLVDVAGMTLLQRSAEDEVLGRVFSVLESLVLATLAVGSLAAPALVSLLGAKAALVIVGGFLPVLLVPIWPLLRRVDAAARIATEPLELLRAIPMFSLLPPTVLERLAGLAAEAKVPAMAEVFAQGDRGDRFYVIAEGAATVEVDGAESSTLGPGDFFGEIALLRDVPRTATVRSVHDLRLFALERDDFIAAVTGHAPTREAAESVVAERLPAGAAL
jgi:MFS family permease